MEEGAEKVKVAAIVPAYNEAARIKPVLEGLVRTPIIDEVIVVDDGSMDGTAEEARKVAGVRVMVNKVNTGKAESLQRAIDVTRASVLFFCDADLKGLTPEIVEGIVRPVVSGEYEMFMGTRSNLLQKAIRLFAINSGERALSRELWESLPRFFRHRYRIEVGLNVAADIRNKGGYGWKRFDYYQTFKEKKYGFLMGTFLRWWMSLDVLCAYLVGVLWRLRRRS